MEENRLLIIASTAINLFQRKKENQGRLQVTQILIYLLKKKLLSMKIGLLRNFLKEEKRLHIGHVIDGSLNMLRIRGAKILENFMMMRKGMIRRYRILVLRKKRKFLV